MDESLELLEYIYQDSEMGVSSLTTLLHSLENKDNKIKKTVEKQLKKYEYFLKESKKELKRNKVDLKKISMMAKVSSTMGIKMNVMKDNSDVKISDILIKGFTMGTLEIKKRITAFQEEADKSILKLAKELLKFQEDSIEELKVYL